MGPDWGSTSRGLIQIPKVEVGQLHQMVEVRVEMRNRQGGFQKVEAVPERQGMKAYIYNLLEYTSMCTTLHIIKTFQATSRNTLNAERL